MLIKAGVDISRLTRDARRALNYVSDYFAKFSVDMIVTSTFEGNHSPGSLHYSNNAFDIRNPSKSKHFDYSHLLSIMPPAYDVVFEKDHIHIEYDP